MKIVLLILSIVLINSVSAADKKIIHFVPPPTQKALKNIKDFLSMSYYLEQQLSLDIKYIYKKDYKDILQGFKDQSIDMAYLGPLPLISLVQQYPQAEPIIIFKNKKGMANYRCVIAKFKNDSFDRNSLAKNQPLKIALTQPLSTCGYLMTERLLKEQFSIDLKQQQFHYTMSHSNALLSVVKGEFLLAGAKDSIARQFESLGMEIIAQSELLPGFSLVVNKKSLSQKQIDAIRSTLLNVPEEIYSHWDGPPASGMIAASIADYDSLNTTIDIPQQGNIK